MSHEEQTAKYADRRNFLKVSAAGVAGTLATAALAGVAGAHAQVNQVSALAAKTSSNLGLVSRFVSKTDYTYFYTLNPDNFYTSFLSKYYYQDTNAAFYVVLSSQYTPGPTPYNIFEADKKKKKPTNPHPSNSFTAIKFYCFDNAPSGVPGRATYPGSIDFLFTTDSDAEGSNYPRFKENDLGYIFSKNNGKQPDGTVPLVRFYTGVGHFYAATSSDFDIASSYGYTREGTVGFVFPPVAI
jgi:hypothetical protein